MITADLVRKLRIRDDVSPAEAETLESLISETVDHKRHATLVREYEHQSASRLLIEGWAARVKILRDGRRQITQLHFAGDYLDLHSFLLKKLDHAIIALTDCKVGISPHDRLTRVTETQPHLTRLLWLNTMIDASIHREWLTATGRMSAEAHIAHLICEIYVRLETIGQVRDHSFDLPLTQEEIGDICGLTAVHVNRVMQELRGRGLIATRQRALHIVDWERLQSLGQFDPMYLNMWKEPR